MKKSIKIALFIIIPILILGLGIVVYNFYPILTMKPTATGKITDTNIYAIKNAMNAVYFIETDDGYIMVDAGSDAKSVEKSLQAAGIATDDVKWILITHSDYDHVASLPLFPHAEIYMSKDELVLVNGTIKRNSGYNSLPLGINIDEINLLHDGEELLFGGTEVKCIKAPGHTNGSMVYLIDEKYLFTGDAFKINGGKMGIHPFTMDTELANQTIDKLKETVNSSLMVLTAHYGYYEKPDLK